jgi:beta-galactosidase
MVDAVQSGVGGDNAWDKGGRPLPQYRVPLKPLRYSYRLSPFTGQGTTPDKAKPASADPQ